MYGRDQDESAEKINATASLENWGFKVFATSFPWCRFYKIQNVIGGQPRVLTGANNVNIL
jgi:hypothetical protein